jgi:hypothetical protein
MFCECVGAGMDARLPPTPAWPRNSPCQPAAYGDLLAAVLAVIAIPAVASNAAIGKPLVWVFNLEGSI